MSTPKPSVPILFWDVWAYNWTKHHLATGTVVTPTVVTLCGHLVPMWANVEPAGGLGPHVDRCKACKRIAFKQHGATFR